MEYQTEEENGDAAWYKLVGDRNIPVKVKCKDIVKYYTQGRMRHRAVFGKFVGITKSILRDISQVIQATYTIYYIVAQIGLRTNNYLYTS